MVGAMRGGAMELEDRLATLPRFRGDHDDDGKERRTAK
ncbi:Amino acid permease 6 [Zea mays]|uniref:Amino acid permease 6 n=1 Tax=Zea mays TaxID=4577 RepID=A0A1D6P1M8_MAIZE|nr:Amino acid permease 6 [Zea mays]